MLEEKQDESSGSRPVRVTIGPTILSTALDTNVGRRHSDQYDINAMHKSPSQQALLGGHLSPGTTLQIMTEMLPPPRPRSAPPDLSPRHTRPIHGLRSHDVLEMPSLPSSKPETPVRPAARRPTARTDMPGGTVRISPQNITISIPTLRKRKEKDEEPKKTPNPTPRAPRARRTAAGSTSDPATYSN